MIKQDENKKSHYFKPGQSGNPKGRPPMPEELKGIKKLSKTELEALLNKYAHTSLEEVEALSKDKSLTVLEACFVKALHKGSQTGDWRYFEPLINRLVGKVKDVFEIQTDPFTQKLDDYISTRSITEITVED